MGAAVIVPMAVRADDKRYYDKKGRDYHVWNTQEDHAYRVYLQGQHQEYRDFATVRPVQQAQYFRWRHGHPDSALVNVEVR
jgi:hypothetical protein